MSFDEKTILAVWKKGTIAKGWEATMWRKDECGAWIKFDAYGDREFQFGWEIDHITSQDHGGSNALSNLRPLQWQNNAAKGPGRLKCVVTAKKNKDRPNQYSQ